MSTAIRVFDNHQHVGGVTGVPGLDPGGAYESSRLEADFRLRVEVMDRLGIVEAALMPGHSYPRPNGLADTRAVNDGLLAYARRNSRRFPAVIGTVEPRYGEEGLAEVDRMKALGMRGVSWHHRQQGLAIDHPAMHRLIDRLERHGLVPYVHCFPGGDWEDVWRLRNLAEAHPGVHFLCMDASSHPEALEEALRCGERVANVSFDLTSLAVGPAAVKRFAAGVGVERVIFGSNLYSMTNPARLHELEAVEAAGFRAEDRARILGGNARRLLGLS